ncbi:hypothetical protein CW354_11985 [Marinicaulis flavus]|uniref:Uncharacterized protein n=2 Tax=Hyphococcus luteus TaxID=2058213 RepID=A0A2S7K4T0_9PROT|nr:hypothetical protein CW354_11985 [Marinicaulis flavus]
MCEEGSRVMPAVDPIPFYPTPSPARKGASPYPRGADALRRFIQGAGAVFLVFLGANTMTGAKADPAIPAEPVAYDFSSVEGLLQTMTASQIAGPAQISAALFLFFAAGQSAARFLGLGAAALAIFLYMQGVTVPDVMNFSGQVARHAGDAINALMAARAQ